MWNNVVSSSQQDARFAVGVKQPSCRGSFQSVHNGMEWTLAPVRCPESASSRPFGPQSSEPDCLQPVPLPLARSVQLRRSGQIRDLLEPFSRRQWRLSWPDTAYEPRRPARESRGRLRDPGNDSCSRTPLVNRSSLKPWVAARLVGGGRCCDPAARCRRVLMKS